MNKAIKVGVIGGGAWGTALAVLANRAGSQVKLCIRNQNVVTSIDDHRVNDIYLPGIYISPDIEVTQVIHEVCNSDLLIVATPTNNVRATCIAISDTLKDDIPILLASKGIERGSLMLMSEVAHAVLPKNPVAAISGPNFADEAAKGLPTATTIACANPEHWDLLSFAIGGKLFRPYMTDDMVGTQIGGAVKNVIAIACGIAIGKGMGDNSRAAIVTRGFAEMSRLAIAKGGRQETLSGLSGIGDLLLTCGNIKSRNMSFGVAIGQGKSVKDILDTRGRTATEGVIAAESVVKLAKKYDVEMPICEAVYAVLHENAELDKVVQSLLVRPFAKEGI